MALSRGERARRATLGGEQPVTDGVGEAADEVRECHRPAEGILVLTHGCRLGLGSRIRW